MYTNATCDHTTKRKTHSSSWYNNELPVQCNAFSRRSYTSINRLYIIIFLHASIIHWSIFFFSRELSLINKNPNAEKALWYQSENTVTFTDMKFFRRLFGLQFLHVIRTWAHANVPVYLTNNIYFKKNFAFSEVLCNFAGRFVRFLIRDPNILLSFRAFTHVYALKFIYNSFFWILHLHTSRLYVKNCELCTKISTSTGIDEYGESHEFNV